MEYGHDTMKAASLMFQRGAKARAVSTRLNIPISTAHRWEIKGVPLPVEQVEHLNGTTEHMNGTGWNALEQEQPEPAKIAILTPEIDVPPVPQTTQQPEQIGFFRQVAQAFHPADLVYYACVWVACSALVGTLKAVAYPVAGVIAAVAFISLHGVKTSVTIGKRRGHIAMLLFLEICFATLHYSWANNALWANARQLPFDIWANKYRDSTGELVHLWGGSDLDKPFYVACGIAVVMLVCSIYVFWIATGAAKERAKK